jgi:hypothetical protein
MSFHANGHLGPLRSGYRAVSRSLCWTMTVTRAKQG